MSMAASDNFTHFLLSMGNLEDKDGSRDSQQALFKVLDFCQNLQKKILVLETSVNDTRKENMLLRAQMEKIRGDFSERVESAIKQRTASLEKAVNDLKQEVSQHRTRMKRCITEEKATELVNGRSSYIQEEVYGRIESRLDEFSSKNDLNDVKETVQLLRTKHDDVASRLEEWARYRKLQEDAEIGVDDEFRTPFNFMHVLHPSKSMPLEWRIREYSAFKTLAMNNSSRRLYSRPFGFEKDGSVRCVLRLVAVFIPNEEVLQFALEILFATKYNRKFDFRFQILPSVPTGKALIKTFSSTEICVPRYWFPQNELQPSGLISFALAVKEDQLRKDGLLVDDCLQIQVGLRE